MAESEMTQDEIIRMAREASNTPIDHHATPDLFGVKQIERFAALVAEPWIETNKALANEIIELQKQAEQEPVARIIGGVLEPCNDDVLSGAWELYAAPVRTKDPCNPLQDLTDDEIEMIFKSHIGKQYDDFARAVIAAYKEKNK